MSFESYLLRMGGLRLELLPEVQRVTEESLCQLETALAVCTQRNKQMLRQSAVLAEQEPATLDFEGR